MCCVIYITFPRFPSPLVSLCLSVLLVLAHPDSIGAPSCSPLSSLILWFSLCQTPTSVCFLIPLMDDVVLHWGPQSEEWGWRAISKPIPLIAITGCCYTALQLSPRKRQKGSGLCWLLLLQVVLCFDCTTGHITFFFPGDVIYGTGREIYWFGVWPCWQPNRISWGWLKELSFRRLVALKCPFILPFESFLTKRGYIPRSFAFEMQAHVLEDEKFPWLAIKKKKDFDQIVNTSVNSLDVLCSDHFQMWSGPFYLPVC